MTGSRKVALVKTQAVQITSLFSLISPLFSDPCGSDTGASVVGKVMVPKDGRIFAPRTCECLSLHGKGTLQV